MSTASQPVYEWKTQNWRKAEQQVFKLQKRIYRASQRGDVKTVHKLQRPLTSSWSARLLATRRVTQDNQGKKTAGVDGIKSLTPPQRLALAKTLKLTETAKPTRRVWIPKPGTLLARFEGRHRNTSGGNALRAAVLGASDGLTTNLSLVMSVAGASLPGHTILFTGLAGMLAGALSMAIGEWFSVQSARELYTRQIEVERQELNTIPEEEQEELALIYQAKGLDQEAAQHMARRIVRGEGQSTTPEAALDTLAREELGIDPQGLGGSAWEAALPSFLLFAIGAIVPVLPFVFSDGWIAVLISLLLGILGLFLIGVGITLTTGAPLVKAGDRQVVLGLLASALTFSLGWLVGGRLG